RRRMNMTHLTKLSRRSLIAAAVAGLLGVATLLAISPARSQATFFNCLPSEFCLYFNEDANGGRYAFEFSDSNLNGDKYEGQDTGETVGNTARAVWNNGDQGLKDDVVVYTQPGYKGSDGCIRLRTSGALPRNWWNNIESFHWATDAQCERAGIIPLAELGFCTPSLPSGGSEICRPGR